MGLGLSVMGDRGGIEGTTAFGGSSGGAAPVDDVTYANAYIYEIYVNGVNITITGTIA